MSDEEILDDYISAAAAVVEAARRLDEARRAYDEAWDEMTRRQLVKTEAEQGLRAALEHLKRASTGRT